MRVISQWRSAGETWGVALFCVFRSGNLFGFSVLGIVFEFGDLLPKPRPLPAWLIDGAQNDFEFLRGKKRK